MATTRVDAVIDALVALVTADSAFTGVGVHDGVPVDDLVSFEEYLVVGGDDVFADEWHTAATVDQGWHDLGSAAARDETVSVPCILEVYRGDDDLPTARARAATLLGAVETLLRANRSLGLSDVFPQTEVAAASWRYRRSADGVGVRVEFTIAVRSLL